MTKLGSLGYMEFMKAGRLCVLFVLIGCHRSSAASRGPGSAELSVGVPLPTACSNVDECERKCSLGVGGACLEEARLYEFGHAGPRDPARAYPLYDRSCNLGNVVGCYNAAVLLEAGRGVSRDARRALELYSGVCSKGSKTACARAATLGGRSL
jgi:TPR repeat protein